MFIFSSVASSDKPIKCWLAKISVGAIRQAWKPLSSASNSSCQRYDGFSWAHIALEQPIHLRISTHVRTYLLDYSFAASEFKRKMVLVEIIEILPTFVNGWPFILCFWTRFLVINCTG
jgi:hypothetical protein